MVELHHPLGHGLFSCDIQTVLPLQSSQPNTVILFIQNAPNPTITCYLQDQPKPARQPLAIYIYAVNNLSEQRLIFIKDDNFHPNQTLH